MAQPFDPKSRDYLGYLIGLVSILISVYISWYFYEKSIQNREPVYFTEPFPQLIFNPVNNQKIPLKVSKEDGTPLDKSVHVSRHVILNQGKLPILAADVLTPITVTVADAELMMVKPEQQSRDVVQCKINSVSPTSFTIEFRVLEQHDGCSVAVIYTGSAYPKFSVSGEVIGTKIKYTPFDINTMLAEVKSGTGSSANFFDTFFKYFPRFLSAALFILFAGFFYLQRSEMESNKEKVKFFIHFLMVTVIFLVTLFVNLDPRRSFIFQSESTPIFLVPKDSWKTVEATAS
ncbi:hypothetical protein [Variovorax sp. EBFNA2]|uniref:hypothetical protein n=1 Tax=Variovorax sp. EBFNA2 TaxID=3342097 RepID=UPI0029C09B4F|nr:hypothetical protein [Variovorax boronicumulans]WPG35299.1 hypothetical protein RZE79_17585 [Variovorax boronicumulans]